MLVLSAILTLMKSRNQYKSEIKPKRIRDDDNFSYELFVCVLVGWLVGWWMVFWFVRWCDKMTYMPTFIFDMIVLQKFAR